MYIRGHRGTLRRSLITSGVLLGNHSGAYENSRGDRVGAAPINGLRRKANGPDGPGASVLVFGPTDSIGGGGNSDGASNVGRLYRRRPEACRLLPSNPGRRTCRGGASRNLRRDTF